MRMLIEPTHLLVYALSQTRTAYSEYFRSLALREQVTDEDEDILREEVSTDKYLTKLKQCLTQGVQPTEEELHNLRDIYLCDLADNNSHSSKKISDVLYLAFGYSLRNQTTALERHDSYKDRITKHPFITDIAVFVEEVKRTKITNEGISSNMELFHSFIVQDTLYDFMNYLHYLYNLQWYEHKYKGTYHAIKNDVSELSTELQLPQTISDLKTFYNYLLTVTDSSNTMELYFSLLNTEFDSMNSLLNEEPLNKLFGGILRPNPQSLTSFLESILIIGCFVESLQTLEHNKGM